jgi:hypothetical protein
MRFAQNMGQPKAVTHSMSFKFAWDFPAEKPRFIPINIESNAWVAAEGDLTGAWSRYYLYRPPVFQGKLFLSPVNSQLTHTREMSPWTPQKTCHRAPSWGFIASSVGPANSHLPETKRLASLFPKGPSLSDDQLDIIVSADEGMFYSVF